MELEELDLVRAYVIVFEDKQYGNQQRSDAFWKRILEHFNVQLGGSDRSCCQVKYKWKYLQKKFNDYNFIYNHTMNSLASGTFEAEVLKDTQSEDCEELTLVRAYVIVCEDKQCGNQHRSDAFLKRILENFNFQLGGSNRSRCQVNS